MERTERVEAAVTTARTGAQTPVLASPPTGLAYQPALDGVRAVAVLLVVVFHLDVGLLGGGYLGVSVFFTMSGFLITSLLLGAARPGRTPSARSRGGTGVDLPRFYVRRVKRLLPASTATLLAVVVLAAVGLIERNASLQGDVTAAAWNVFNWRELASGSSYAELFESESAVAHFWSLAIEEQFYLCWPVILVVLLELVGRRRTGLLAVLSLLFAASTVSALVAAADVAYFATWTRAAEILAGAILATWMWNEAGPADTTGPDTRTSGAGVPGTTSSPTESPTESPTDRPSWWSKLAAPALGVIVVASIVTPTSSGWAYAGGLPLFSVVSVALIAGLQAPGRMRNWLSLAPLVALGRISYGVYLVHWPVFVVLDEQRLGAGGWTLAAVRLTTTALVAGIMYVALERPIRTSSRTVRPIAVAAAALAAIVAVTIAAAAVSPATTASDPAPAVIGAPLDPEPAPPSSNQPTTAGESAVTAANPAANPPTNPPTNPPVANPAADRAAAGQAADPAADRPAGAGAASPVDGPSAAAAEVPTGATAGYTGLSGIPVPDTDTGRAVVVDEVVPSPPPAADIASEQPPVAVAVFGDSIPAWLLRDAAASYDRSDAVLLNGALEGCDGMVDLPRGRDRRETEMVVPDDCVDWTVSYPRALSDGPPADIGLLMIGQAPVVDRLVDERWQGPCDSIDWYLDDVVSRVEFLRDADIEPILALPARYGEGVTFIVTDDHLERIQCIRSALRDTAIRLDVAWIDLDEFLCPDENCDVRRTVDGVHVDAVVAPIVLDELLDRVLATSDHTSSSD